MSKRIPFKTYRYHLVPFKTDQLSIFGNPTTVEELKEKKNNIFEDILNSTTSLRGRDSAELPIERDYAEDNVFLLKLAIDRKTTLYRDFKPINVDNQPFVYIALNNKPEIQKILIEDNKAAFYDTNAVKNILKDAFGSQLAKYELTIHIEPVIDKGTFWDFVKKHERSIERLDFEIVKPNLASISKSLKEPLKQLIDISNSHKTSIKLKAPDNGVLENINEKNDQLSSLVNYSNEGGGDGIKMKIKGVKKTVSTRNMVKEVYISSIEIEASNQQNLLNEWIKKFDE